MPALLEIAAGIVLVLTAVTAISMTLRRLGRFLRLSVHAFETIQRELNPNGGGSTHDLVRKLSTRMDDTDAKIAAVQASADAAKDVAVTTATLTAVQYAENAARLDRLEVRAKGEAA